MKPCSGTASRCRNDRVILARFWLALLLPICGGSAGRRSRRVDSSHPASDAWWGESTAQDVVAGSSAHQNSVAFVGTELFAYVPFPSSPPLFMSQYATVRRCLQRGRGRYDHVSGLAQRGAGVAVAWMLGQGERPVGWELVPVARGLGWVGPGWGRKVARARLDSPAPRGRAPWALRGEAAAWRSDPRRPLGRPDRG